jgi:hypothetical protein
MMGAYWKGMKKRWIGGAFPLGPSISLDEDYSNAVCIPLTRGQHALIDVDDFDRVTVYKWNAVPTPKAATSAIQPYYARRSARLPRPHNRHMHQEIMPPPPGMFVDHRDGNPLDNRKKNLRLATRKQNNVNVPRPLKTQGRFKGTALDRRSGKWRGQIQNDGQKIHLGMYSTEEEAALAYNRAAREFFGEFATLNLIEGVDQCAVM